MIADTQAGPAGHVYEASTWLEERIRQMGSITAALEPDANGELPQPPTRDIEFHQQAMLLPEQAEFYAFTPVDAGTYHHERPRRGRPAIRIHHLAKWFHKLMPWTRMMYTSKPTSAMTMAMRTTPGDHEDTGRQPCARGG